MLAVHLAATCDIVLDERDTIRALGLRPLLNSEVGRLQAVLIPVRVSIPPPESIVLTTPAAPVRSSSRVRKARSGSLPKKPLGSI
jgi:hypothetical protein